MKATMMLFRQLTSNMRAAYGMLSHMDCATTGRIKAPDSPSCITQREAALLRLLERSQAFLHIYKCQPLMHIFLKYGKGSSVSGSQPCIVRQLVRDECPNAFVQSNKALHTSLRDSDFINNNFQRAKSVSSNANDRHLYHVAGRAMTAKFIIIVSAFRWTI